MTSAQTGYIVGMCIAAALLSPVILMYRNRCKYIEKANAHISNDNDFLHTEMAMLASRCHPELIKRMKDSEEYNHLVAQYQGNRNFIKKYGRRP